MTLEKAAFEVAARIVDLSPLDEAERARLSGLGLRPGATITKLMPTPLRDPVACLVGRHLLAIERRLLSRIQVETVPEGSAARGQA